MTADDLAEALLGLPPAWAAVLPGWTTERLRAVVEAVRGVSGTRPIAPADPLRALRLVGPAAVRVLVLGQDPYPTAGHADGLAFSAARGRPPSLRRIFAVLAADRPGWVAPAHGRLDAWARQGVLLLNPVLTVEEGRAGSHQGCGWQALTSEIVQVLCHRSHALEVLLWGARAQGFFDAAVASVPPSVRVWRTRHPAHDFQRTFMSEGSHFLGTAHCVDWWASS